MVDDGVDEEALALLVDGRVELLVETEVVTFVESEVEITLVDDVSVEPSTLVVSEPVVDGSEDKEGVLGKTISHEASNKVIKPIGINKCFFMGFSFKVFYHFKL